MAFKVQIFDPVSGFFLTTSSECEDLEVLRQVVEDSEVFTGVRLQIIDDAGTVHYGPVIRDRNSTLPDPLLRRIRDVHARVRDVHQVTLEEFEIPFMRAADPEGEVTVWELIVAADERVAAAMPDVEKTTVLRTLLGYSMDSLTPVELADPTVRRIIGVAERG